jgi:hypothetical protein
VPASPDDLLKSADSGPALGVAPAVEVRARFWAAEPATAYRQGRAASAVAVTARPAVVLPLASGVSLIVEGRSVKQPETAALHAIRPAIDGLRAALAEAGIIVEGVIIEEDGHDLGHRQNTMNQGDDHVS